MKYPKRGADLTALSKALKKPDLRKNLEKRYALEVWDENFAECNTHDAEICEGIVRKPELEEYKDFFSGLLGTRYVREFHGRCDPCEAAHKEWTHSKNGQKEFNTFHLEGI